MNYFEFLRNAYPKGLRSDDKSIVVSEGFAENTLCYKYDEIRGIVLDMVARDIKQSFLRTIVQTADEDGLTEWELFLNIYPSDTDTVAQRREMILELLLGYDATKKVIRDAVVSFIGGDGSNVSFYERYHNTTPTELDLWTYEIHIQLPVVKNFSIEDLYKRILQLHPAHTNLILILDGLPTGGWESDTPAPDDLKWGGFLPQLTDIVWA